MIGERYGPLDVAFMENGAYNPKGWPLVHMTPEQSAQAAADIRTKVAVPIHWGKFDLAYHTWTDPIQRFLQAAANQPYQTATPQIGQVFDLQNLPQGKKDHCRNRCPRIRRPSTQGRRVARGQDRVGPGHGR